MQKKRVESYGLFQTNHLQGMYNALLVPIYGFNEEGEQTYQSLQIISPAGSKRFLKGGKKTGGYYCLRIPEKDSDIIISEGYATAATLAEIYPSDGVYCAFDSGNLKSVAITIRKLYPTNKIIIAGDNDHYSVPNIGKEKAIEAAQAINGSYAIPEFKAGETGTDWNDYYKPPQGVTPMESPHNNNANKGANHYEQ